MTPCLRYFDKRPNAGDLLAPRLAEHWFDGGLKPCGDQDGEAANLLVIGSILAWANRASIVCGAGALRAAPLRESPRSVISVRGPRTLALLHTQSLDAEFLADPGVLAPLFFPRAESARHPVGIVPHYVDKDAPWLQQCAAAGVPVIDVEAPLDSYFRAIQSCDRILSSSLHGIIFAHAYGIPALWIELSDKVLGDGFKFLDYYESASCPAAHVIRHRVQLQDDPIRLANSAFVLDIAPLQAQATKALDSARALIERRA